MFSFFKDFGMSTVLPGLVDFVNLGEGVEQGRGGERWV